MMNLDKLYQILDETTVPLRKGEELTERQQGPVHVTEIFAMPHTDEPEFNDIEKVDLVLLAIGVERKKAENRKAELIEILKTYPDLNRLADGPSYIEVGATIGSQGAAFQLFALGKILGLWEIITPETLHITGEKAKELARSGFIMIAGWKGNKNA